MRSVFRLAILSALVVVACCDLDNQYFVWGKFGELFSPKGVQVRADGLVKKFDELEKRMNASIEKHERMFNAVCPVRYDGKCFRAILHASTDTDRNEAFAMCQNIGWKLASVYSRAHFKLLEKYLREASSTNPSVWLTMTWNYSSRTIIMPGGTRPPTDVPWYNGNPTSSSSYNSIYMIISQNADYRYNGMLNRPANTNLLGALCEIDIEA